MSIPISVGGPIAFKTFLRGAGLLLARHRGDQLTAGPGRDVGELCWSLWLDPGVHTGLAAAVYFRAPRVLDKGTQQDWDGHGLAESQWHRVIAQHQLNQDPGFGITAARDFGWAALGRNALALYTELLTGDEHGQVRRAVGLVGQLGAVWSGHVDWDTSEGPRSDALGVSVSDGECGLGPAGVGAESFTNMRAERDPEYLSPVRVRTAFSYALEDQFGVVMKSQQPGDAKTQFGNSVLKAAGLSRPGPDHIADATSHLGLAIRKNG